MKEKGFLHALVSVFGQVDLDHDVMFQGVFKNSLNEWKRRRKWPVGVFSHDLRSPIARTLDVWEEADGLHILAEFNLGIQRGLEAYRDIYSGVLSEYSIGFQVKKSKNVGKIREIYEVDLIEWSPVVFGAHSGTRTFAVGDYKDVISSICKKLESHFLRNEFELLV